jgi:transcription elongation factor Elf1
VKDIEDQMPENGFFFKESRCPRCGAQSMKSLESEPGYYLAAKVDRNGYTVSCDQCWDYQDTRFDA